MIPLKDNIPSRRVPIVNYLIIGTCAVVFFFQLQDGNRQGGMIERYGMIPHRISKPHEPVMIRSPVYEQTRQGIRRDIETHEAAMPPFHPWWTIITSMFLHGGWLHIIGNLWFLHIFGDNVEDRLGSLGFAAFYLTCGIVAGLAHFATDPLGTVPTVGASGAIAGVMGAYFLLYPRARVLTLVPIFFFLHIVVLPAVLFLGIWILIQLLQGSMAITAATGGGVAWWAHIGGFAAGLIIAGIAHQSGWLRPGMPEAPVRSEAFRDYRRQRREEPWI